MHVTELFKQEHNKLYMYMYIVRMHVHVHTRAHVDVVVFTVIKPC